MFGFNNRSVEVEKKGGWWQFLEHSFTPTTKKSQSSSMLEPKIVNSTDVTVSIIKVQFSSSGGDNWKLKIGMNISVKISNKQSISREFRIHQFIKE